jgi:hypothetical protein
MNPRTPEPVLSELKVLISLTTRVLTLAEGIKDLIYKAIAMAVW